MYNHLCKLSTRSNGDNDDSNQPERKRSHDSSEEEKDLADCLMMLSKSAVLDHNLQETEGRKVIKPKGSVFQCKSCKKVFASHQALGGHRASHKKVKGCFAAKADQTSDDEEQEDDRDVILKNDEETLSDKPTASVPRKQSKGHECTICHRVFASGQALGGHKRCHWLTPTNHQKSSASSTFEGKSEPLDRPVDLKLDLNLPSPEFLTEIDQKNCEDTLTNMNDSMDLQVRKGSSSSWLQIASGDWFNY